MKRSRWLAALAALGATLAIGVPIAASNVPGETVTIKTKISISAYGYLGKVTAPNENCVEERTVVLKQKGHGVLGRDTTNSNGKWEVSPEDLHFKGPLPYELFAEVKPVTQGHRRHRLQVPRCHLEDDRNRRRLSGSWPVNVA